MKKMIVFILLLVWLLVIFLFSSQDGVGSKHTSNQFIDKIVDISSLVTGKKVSKEMRKIILKKYSPIVRKIAHFMIYFILGVIVCSLTGSYLENKEKVIWISILFCFLYACSDELHQLLLVGRTFKVKDIIIDTIGSSLGIMITKNRKIRGWNNEKIN